MSFSVLVRRNVLDPYRSRSLWILLGVFVLSFGLVGYLLSGNVGGGMAFSMAQVMTVLAPLAALSFAYDSIAGPRQSGSLRVLLSYPYSRRELVLGTLVGRVLLLALAVTAGVVAGTLSAVVFGGTVDVVAVASVLLLSILLSTTIVGVALGISASVRTSTRAAIGAFGAYLLFSAFWTLLPSVARYVLNGFSFPTGQPPDWTFVWNQLNPINAFQTAVGVVAGSPVSDAVYHTLWFAVLVLLGWLVLSTVVGTLRFERTDL